MPRFAAALSLAAALLAAPAASAQAVQPAPGAQAKASPRAEALVRRYLKAVDFERQMDVMLTAMLPMMRARMTAAHPDLTAEQHRLLAETTLEVMRESVTPKLIEESIPIYASTFTEAELEAIVAFYESPPGRAITEKTPILAPKVAAMTQKLLPGAVEKMMVRLCRKIDCEAKPDRRAS